MSTAVVVIAHGSREASANADAVWAAQALQRTAGYSAVEAAFLELAEPDIDAAAEKCVRQGARQIVLLPYFLSEGVHVRRDLAAAQGRLRERYPQAAIVLAEPLGRHDLLIDVLAERTRAALDGR